MRVVVFGAGATGSVLGARLASAGLDVELVGRRTHVAAIRSRGLEVEGLPGGPFRIPASEALAPGTKADRVLLTVKSFDLETAAHSLTEGMAAPAPVLSLENGLGIEEVLANALARGGWAPGDAPVVRGVNTIPSTFLGPGRVRLAGEGEILLGEAGSLWGDPAGFGTLLELGGVRVRVVPSIAREVWRKALVNAAINPITADHAIENGKLALDPWRGQALALLHEARSVAGAEGFDFSASEAEAELFRIVRSTALNRSSMLQDIEAGRPTEIDAISGAIGEVGRRHGIQLPHTQRAIRRVRARVAGSRPPPTART